MTTVGTFRAPADHMRKWVAVDVFARRKLDGGISKIRGAIGALARLAARGFAHDLIAWNVFGSRRAAWGLGC